MSAIVAVDTETTGLSLSDEIWEFAAIRREEDGTEERFHYFIHHDRAKALHLPKPFLLKYVERWDGSLALPPRKAAERMVHIFEGRPHVIGCVPNFDMERITALMDSFDCYPDHHYHLIDVETLTVGFLRGVQWAHDPWADFPRGDVLVDDERRLLGFDVRSLPWKSDDLAQALGVVPPTDKRHEAMADAEWALAIYDKVMGS